MLKVSYLDGDVHFREQMRAFLLDALRPLVDDAVREGLADGSLFTRHPAMLGELLLMLVCDLNDEVCRQLAEDAQNPDCVVEIMERMDAYREAVELLSGAPHGKIFLFELEHLLDMLRQTARELNSLREKA